MRVWRPGFPFFVAPREDEQNRCDGSGRGIGGGGEIMVLACCVRKDGKRRRSWRAVRRFNAGKESEQLEQGNGMGLAHQLGLLQ